MPAQPHLVLITCDQLRRDALSCFGQEAIATPHIDRLAARSTDFSRAYANSPVCLPSRCSIATGLYPHRHGGYSNFRPVSLDPSRPNLYNTLREQGYRTAHIGKCHYTPAPYDLVRQGVTQDLEPVKDFYLSLGMDHLDLQNGKCNSIWFWNDYSREMEAAGHLASYREAVQQADPQGLLRFPGPPDWHPDAWVARKSLAYLDGLDLDRPSCTWISFSGPHYPCDPPAAYLDRVDATRLAPLRQRADDFTDTDKLQANAYHGRPGMGAEGARWTTPVGAKHLSDDHIRQFRIHYLANVALLDELIGEILAWIDAHFGPEALIVFTTDHGEMAGDHHLLAKNACVYEQNLNVPLLVRFPDQTASVRSDALVQLVDLFPTLLTAAGLEAQPPSDGRPLQTSLHDGGHPFVFAEMEGLVAVCDGRYKYAQLKQPDGLKAELYDLRADPDEFDNLLHRPEAGAQLARLRGALIDHFVATTLA